MLGLLVLLLLAAAALLGTAAPAAAEVFGPDPALDDVLEYRGNLVFEGDGDGMNGPEDDGSAKHHDKYQGAWNQSRQDDNGTVDNVYDDTGYRRKSVSECETGEDVVVYMQAGYDCLLDRNANPDEFWMRWAQFDRDGRETTEGVVTIYTDWDNDGDAFDQDQRVQSHQPGTVVFWVGEEDSAEATWQLKTIVVLDGNAQSVFIQRDTDTNDNPWTGWNLQAGDLVPFEVALLGSSERSSRTVYWNDGGNSDTTTKVTWGWHRRAWNGPFEPLGFDAVSFEIFVRGPGRAHFRAYTDSRGLGEVVGHYLRGNDPNLFVDAGERAASLLRPIGPDGTDLYGYRLQGEDKAGGVILDTTGLPPGEYEIVLRVQHADTSNWLTKNGPARYAIQDENDVIPNHIGDSIGGYWGGCVLFQNTTNAWNGNNNNRTGDYLCDDGITRSPHLPSNRTAAGPEQPVPSFARVYFQSRQEFTQKFSIGDASLSHLAEARLIFRDGLEGPPLAETTLTVDQTADVNLHVNALSADGQQLPERMVEWVKVNAPGAEIFPQNDTNTGICHDNSARNDWSNDVWTSPGRADGTPKNNGVDTGFCIRSQGDQPRTVEVTIDLYTTAEGGGHTVTSRPLTVTFTGPAAALGLPAGAAVEATGAAAVDVDLALTAADANGIPVALTADPGLHVTVVSAEGEELADVTHSYLSDLHGDMTNVPGVRVTLPAGTEAGRYTVAVALAGTDGEPIAGSEARAEVQATGEAAIVSVVLDPPSGGSFGSIVTATATITDQFGNPVSGQEVLFQFSSGLTRVGPATPNTNADGVTSQTFVVVGQDVHVITARTAHETAPDGTVSGGISEFAVLPPAAPEEAPAATGPTGSAALTTLTGFAAYRGEAPSTAAELFGGLESRGATAVLLYNSVTWLRYAVLANGQAVPGSVAFTVLPGDIIYIAY